jgi:hypothetical protein
VKSYPPASEMSADDLLELAADVGRDPALSYDLAGSRGHIEAVCRLAVSKAQDLDFCAHLNAKAADARDAAERGNRALQLQIAALTNERDRLAVNFRAARQAIAEREDEIGRVNNERQAEVNEAADQRERADTAESIAEVFEATARAALAILARGRDAATVGLAELARAVDGRLSRALVRERQITARLTKQMEDTALLLDQQREDREANDRIHSAFASAVPVICDGVTVEDLNHRLDAELAANPDPVCSTCKDTHSMPLNGTEVMCTRCPVPCERCRRQDPQGPYCATTPCACGCHGADYPHPDVGPLHHARDRREHDDNHDPARCALCTAGNTWHHPQGSTTP